MAKKTTKRTPKVFLDANIVISAGKPPGGPDRAEQQGDHGERHRGDGQNVALAQDPLAVRMAVGKFHITPPSVEDMRVAWLSGR